MGACGEIPLISLVDMKIGNNEANLLQQDLFSLSQSLVREGVRKDTSLASVVIDASSEG